MESSLRDLSNDMAEHRPVLKNNQNTYYHRFSFTPKTGVAFPQTGVFLFTVSWNAIKFGGKLWKSHKNCEKTLEFLRNMGNGRKSQKKEFIKIGLSLWKSSSCILEKWKSPGKSYGKCRLILAAYLCHLGLLKGSLAPGAFLSCDFRRNLEWEEK